MRRRGLGMLFGLVIGLVVLAVAPDATFAEVGSPAWWVKGKINAEAGAHVAAPGELALEPTAIEATSISFVVYVKPIAGVRVTDWAIGIGDQPECQTTKEVEYHPCLSSRDDGYNDDTLVEGHILEGSPEEYVAVTASTANGGYLDREFYFDREFGIPLGPAMPIDVLPGRVYLVQAGEWTKPETPHTQLNGAIQVLTPGALAPAGVLKKEARKAAGNAHRVVRRLEREHPEDFR